MDGCLGVFYRRHQNGGDDKKLGYMLEYGGVRTCFVPHLYFIHVNILNPFVEATKCEWRFVVRIGECTKFLPRMIVGC